MKRILLLFVAVAAVAFAGCSKDDDGASNPLDGSQWELVEEGISVSLNFINPTECQYVLKTTLGGEYAKELYTYVYSEPVVTLTPLKVGLAVMKGTVSGSAMTLVNTSSGKTVGILIRQN